MNASRSPAPPTLRLAILAVALALGCAGAQRPTSSRAPSVETLADGSQIVCELEKPTGSHISERVCRKVQNPNVQRARLQSQLVAPKASALP